MGAPACTDAAASAATILARTEADRGEEERAPTPTRASRAHRLVLLDVKAAGPPEGLAAGGTARGFRSDAERLVETQRVGQAVPNARLAVLALPGTGLPGCRGPRVVAIKALQPTDDRLDISTFRNAAELVAVAADMGRVAAWSHLRGAGRRGAAPVEELMSWGRRADWRTTLMAHATAARDTLLAHHAAFVAAAAAAPLAAAAAAAPAAAAAARAT